jgi:hypothetical protein
VHDDCRFLSLLGTLFDNLTAICSNDDFLFGK